MKIQGKPEFENKIANLLKRRSPNMGLFISMKILKVLKGAISHTTNLQGITELELKVKCQQVSD